MPYKSDYADQFLKTDCNMAAAPQIGSIALPSIAACCWQEQFPQSIRSVVSAAQTLGFSEIHSRFQNGVLLRARPDRRDVDLYLSIRRDDADTVVAIQLGSALRTIDPNADTVVFINEARCLPVQDIETTFATVEILRLLDTVREVLQQRLIKQGKAPRWAS